MSDPATYVLDADERVSVLLAHFEAEGDTDVRVDDVEHPRGDDFTSDTFDSNGQEWFVLTDAEADEAARDRIRDSVWAFRPEFVEAYVPNGVTAEHVRRIVGDSCEDANAPVLALIEAGRGFDAFAADAMAADGRGHFLSGYDGEEVEREHGGATIYLYRHN